MIDTLLINNHAKEAGRAMRAFAGAMNIVNAWHKDKLDRRKVKRQHKKYKHKQWRKARQ